MYGGSYFARLLNQTQKTEKRKTCGQDCRAHPQPAEPIHRLSMLPPLAAHRCLLGYGRLSPDLASPTARSACRRRIQTLAPPDQADEDKHHCLDGGGGAPLLVGEGATKAATERARPPPPGAHGASRRGVCGLARCERAECQLRMRRHHR